jgi:hypothetical protein
MSTAILNISNFSVAPFPDVVRKGMEEGLQPLIHSGALQIDFKGSSTATPYKMDFDDTYVWTNAEHDRCWYHPRDYGLTGSIFVEALRRANSCDDVADAATCELVFRSTPQELGLVVAYTAVHEAAHLFGLQDGGADGAGHTPDAGNFMFDIALRADYPPRTQDRQRTKKYRIQQGDTISAIADRIGFRPPLATWQTLSDFRGQDGKRNRDLLRSHNPNLIGPGDEIWIPDMRARLVFRRSLELQPKSFTSAQVATMKQFIASGKTVIQEP